MSYIRNYVDVHVSSNKTSSKSMILNELFKPHQTVGYYVKWGAINVFIILGVFALLVITALAIKDFLKRQIAINKLNTSSKHFSHKDFNG
ncbi:hypothetical protein A3O16_02960 [Ligilactobacillus aviarius]|uniref:Uncharacterized protein n=1 Tax=Ligilactobacillus aviarius TaxID=1606 RepID=A0A179CQY7_9LACO|nr:hypothetical protein A3O07_02040 [Ligilactobacillus aviarius]OAQ01284.1 hypothetical protein A3O08_02105 [Ligilactobacillus aviarius]OAQ01835.1 hypothetical protein A3O09_01120 [Ligilactobacillus aviarius]OAQ05445.1 hypothetical protein A3O13_03745 [Ligilactobacillus aviarius]OAQ07921.1 hypothetical protein A3O15_05635 [Ligilactobacillus aviarius]